VISPVPHRSQAFKDLYAGVQPRLGELFGTTQLVYLSIYPLLPPGAIHFFRLGLSTSSAWGVMEGALRNLVTKKVLNAVCGAFSDKWFDVAKRCGKSAETLQIPWGSPVRAEAVDSRLRTGQFDALTLIHNETSTGVMSPLQEIAVLKRWQISAACFRLHERFEKPDTQEKAHGSSGHLTKPPALIEGLGTSIDAVDDHGNECEGTSRVMTIRECLG
jgi:hypothetical protein